MSNDFTALGVRPEDWRSLRSLPQAAVGTTVRIIGPKKAHPANAGLSVEQPMNSSFTWKVVLIELDLATELLVQLIRELCG